MEFKKEDYLGRTAILIYIFFVITSIFLINFAIDFLSDSMASYRRCFLHINDVLELVKYLR